MSCWSSSSEVEYAAARSTCQLAPQKDGFIELTGVGGYHAVDGGHDNVEEGDKFVVVLGTDVETTNLRKTFEGDIPELWDLEELTVSYRPPLSEGRIAYS